MNKKEETIQTWNKLAQLYQEKFMDLDLYNSSYDQFCNAVKTHKARILEIGCGPGMITRYLHQKRSDISIHGIDVAPTMIELAKANNPSATFEVMDCREIAHLNASFDGIIAGFCLPYISSGETAELIKNCADILNDQGVFYISFVEGDPTNSGFQVGSTGDRSYFYFHQLDTIHSQLKENNFERIQVLQVDYGTGSKKEVHTIMIAHKSKG